MKSTNNKQSAASIATALSEWCTKVGLQDVVDTYHSDHSESHRTIVSQRLKRRKTLIAVCTDAFGMGADCREVTRVVQWKLFGGIPAWWQRMGRAGRDFADDAEAILLVEAAHIDSATKKALADTGELPNAYTEDEEAAEPSEPTQDGEEAQTVSTKGEKKPVRQIVDTELIALTRHGLARDACVRKIVLEHLCQPAQELLPTAEELYNASRTIAGDRKLRCCSSCDKEELPKLPEHLIPAKPSLPTLSGIVALQKTLRARLETWRLSQWRDEWRGMKKAGRLGIDAFLSLQDIDAVVSNLKLLASNISEGNSRIATIVNMPNKAEVLDGLEEKVVGLLNEEKERKEQERAAQEEERRQRAEESRKRHEAHRVQRSERELQGRIEQAVASGSKIKQCSTCSAVNSNMLEEIVDSRGHRSE
ncbi:hypothetical protein V8E36_005966 [Tilletia maclaganii]